MDGTLVIVNISERAAAILDRRDRSAMVGLVAALVAVAVVSATVEHGRHGGPITPAALASQTAAAPTRTVVAGEALAAPGAGYSALAAAPSGALGATGNTAGGLGAPKAPAPTPPAGGGGSTFLPFPPPQVPVPAIPPQLQAFAGLASPLSFFACQYFGLVPLAAALGGALGAPVSLSDLLPYMKPIFDICLIPGVPVSEANCALDQQLDEGVGLPAIPVALGLSLVEVVQGIPVPRPEGLVIDELAQIEHTLLGAPDGSARPSDALGSALGCTQP